LNRQFHLTILGSNSAVPAYGRFPTSQYLKINDHKFLIDCGEGTQIRIGQYRIKRNQIEHIFISHLHGDHVYGLPGLLTSMSLNDRKEPLSIFGPVGIKEMIETMFRFSRAYMSYELSFIELDLTTKTEILVMPGVKISAFPVYHRLPCYGYMFEERFGEKNVIKEKIGEYRLSVDEIKALKRGEDIARPGEVLYNTNLTHPTPDPVSYAFCADSIARDSLASVLKNATAIYFETTYLDDMKEQAAERGHSTAKQSAILARKAEAKVLITGHYSSRYRDLEAFRQEALAEFPNVILGRDGEMINLLDYQMS